MKNINDCHCGEGFSKRKIGGVPGNFIYEVDLSPTGLHVHNCEYIARRNSVLDKAESVATDKCGTSKSRLWHIAFFAAVDKLSKVAK